MPTASSGASTACSRSSGRSWSPISVPSAGVRPIIAGAGALALGAVGTVWAAATIAEVNSLHLLFGALILHRALVWEDRRSPVDLVIGGLLVGLALGNHLLTLFIVPFVAVFVLWTGRREILARPLILVPALAAVVLGLAVYLYVPLAAGQSPPLPYNSPVTLDGVLWLVSGTQFRDQFDFLSALTQDRTIDWRRVELFHLDEYVALPIEHPASFRRYLMDRLIGPAGITRYHFLDAERDAEDVAERVGLALARAPLDLAFVGIGENGHLAFNDPPADFATERPYLVVSLDAACRRQQVGEGWFASVDDVPERAVTMSIHSILSAREIIAVVPDARKAQAVRACVEGDVTPLAPASILRPHPNVTLYLDADSAALLSPDERGDALDGE